MAVSGDNKAFADYITLHELFCEKPLDTQNFEAHFTLFQKRFNKNDYLSVGTLLLFLIRQGDSPLPTKLVGYFILMDLFKSSGQAESPFLGALVTAFESKELSSLNLVEKFFLGQLLVNGTPVLAKQTPSQIMLLDMQFMASFVQDVIKNKLPNIKRPDLPISVKAARPNVAPAPPHVSEITDKKELLEGLAKNPDCPLKNIIAPEFITIVPPLLPCIDEMIWLDLSNPAWHKPVYDTTVPMKTSFIETKRLMSQAFKQALTTQDQQRLFAELDNDPELINQIGLLTPQKLPELVDNNPMVAIHVLLKLMKSEAILEYLSVLVKMDLSLYSIEVVNRLTNSVALPLEFVHLYISNCISNCETIKDKYMQNRLVRLVCVFLQSLIRNKIINVKELFLELESFCIEFNWIREAAALYRLLRQLETDQQAATSPGGTTST